MWTTIEYTDAVFDETSRSWVSRAEVAETFFTAFAGQKKSERVPGRLVVRRIPDFNADKKAAAGQGTLFDVWRFHAFFTTADPAILDTIIEAFQGRSGRPAHRRRPAGGLPAGGRGRTSSWSIALAGHCPPRLAVTVLEVPQVAQIARKRIAGSGPGRPY